MHNIFKLIVISFFIFISYASGEVIKFSSSTYEGELKNGKAHGFGTLTFTDGTKYVGEFKKNIIHGNGKYMDLDGNITSGKWTHGKIRKKIDNNNREVLKLNRLTGKVNYFETKGSGGNNLWFEAVPKVVSAEEMAAAANKSNIELDIFDTPSVFSIDYGNEDKIKELLAEKIEKVSAEDNKLNNGSSKIAKNNNIVYVLTEKGQRDKQSSEQAASNTTGQTETQVATSSSSSSSGSGGSGGSGSGC